MSVAASPSDTRREPQTSDPLAPIRARGFVALAATRNDGATRLVSLDERGGYRCKFPHAELPWLDAVIVNTGGGVAGGDRIELAARASGSAALRVSTATAERIYRSLGASTVVSAHIDVADRATLVWAPQPTIVFTGSRLDRRYDISVSAGATLLMAETICFGRRDSGETLGSGSLHDRWFITHDQTLVHAEINRLGGIIDETLARPAALAGAHVAATLLLVAADAGDHLDAVRDVLASAPCVSGAGCRDGLLIVRAIGDRLEHAERLLSDTTACLLARRQSRIAQPATALP